MKALVTGATGYIGGRLAARLIQEGACVHAVVRSEVRDDRLARVPEGVTVHRHNGTTDTLIDVLARTRPDTVFHVAALVLGDHIHADIEPLIQSNVLFGTQLLEGAVAANVPAFVNTGTFWQHRAGTAAYDPVCLYAATKQAFEDVLAYYVRSTSLRALTLMLFDTYGPGDPRPKLLNTLVQAAERGTPLELTAGEQRLHLVHVDDVTKAYLRAAELLHSGREDVLGKSFAVCPQESLSLRQVVALLEQALGRPVPVAWGGRPYRPREVMMPWPGEPLPAWQPQIPLPAGFSEMCSASRAG